MKKKICFLVDSNTSEKWFTHFLSYLENNADIYVKYLGSPPTKFSLYNLITGLFLKFEQRLSKALNTDYFQKADLTSYAFRNEELPEGAITVNLSSYDVPNSIQIVHNSMVVNLRNLNNLLFVKSGLPIKLVATLRNEFFVQALRSYNTSNNSFFISSRKSNLIAALTDLILFAITNPSHEEHISNSTVTPTFVYFIRYIALYPFNLIQIKSQAFAKNIKWHICYVTPSGKQTILKLPTGEFWADPFILKQKDTIEILFERMPVNSNKGVISVYNIEKQTYKDILSEPFHLSFPYPLYMNESCYVIPESKQNRSINLYILESMTQRLKHLQPLIQNIEAVDSTILKKADLYWLFCTVKSTPLSNSGDALMLFYSSTLNGTWEPHKNNPVKLDNTNSRGAGSIFQQDNKWFRPVQNCSTRYGGSVKLMKIQTLTVDEFVEVETEEIFPSRFHKKAKGLHTFSFSDGHITVDLQIKTTYVR